MKVFWTIAKFFSLVLVFCIALSSNACADNGLSIGFDEKTDRPNAFIAWRNTQRILEVELEVKNYSDEQATGYLEVSILNEEGQVLLSNSKPQDTPQTVTLPPRAKGGAEGRIVQMKGTFAMNSLIDELDRANSPYSLRAKVTPVDETSGASVIAVKSFNVNSKIKPDAVHFHDYTFRNNTEKPLNVVWKLSSSDLPDGWIMYTEHKEEQENQIMPGETINGYITIKTPGTLKEGQHIDTRVTAVDKETQQPLFQDEWFTVYDTTPPETTGLGYSVDPETGIIEVTFAASDTVSMLKEASGVRVEYSTDNGLTYSDKTMFYLAGNFVGPTKFKANLGPFAPGTNLKVNAIAEDIAGNSVKRIIEPIQIVAVSDPSFT
ncbi:hypothetical protein IQ268_12120 [Oculatella sp. LEGE 06141]|uniref:hypothetical protein n=1 Tax=Oculatella sp. LEGE 06141 TaxID=1828648 RepID=UPI0018822569|nr:hypothetical protein [Oculatella sp. LEGE 06141]MBE9179307.1 hypothetical protein [Oculatella sp. LEGE 06141]